MTVREIIDEIIGKTGVERIPYDMTCDRLMSGDMDQEVTGIASTFMATVDVIKEAADKGCNLIITHEPTWFTGKDDIDWLENDPVYKLKKQLIEDHGMAIWRFHDHMHFADEDGIYRGIEMELGWQEYRMEEDESIMPGHFDGCYQIPSISLSELCSFFKTKLDMDVIQIIGDPETTVERVSILPGGGSLGLGNENMPMRLMQLRGLDLIICGEILEWTLPAYVRDAHQLGLNKAIMVLGHERSEEPGMKHLPAWLESIAEGIPLTFIDAGEPFAYL